MVVYAKSKPIETLIEHTNNLLKNLEILKKHYHREIEEKIPEKYRDDFWNLLDICIRCHDLGKVYTPFQNKIRKDIGEKLLDDKGLPDDVRHNLLSPVFMKEVVKEYSKELQTILYLVVALHHLRDEEWKIITNQNNAQANFQRLVKEIIEKDFSVNLYYPEILEHLNLPIPKKLSYKFVSKLDKNQNQLLFFHFPDLKTLYILLKGFLHRLDHSSSAHIPVEEEKILDREDMILKYLHNKNISYEKIWQKEVLDHQNDNIILIASTGIGKTEYAYFWAEDKKTFYTLPVRTSVNAMFERTKDIFEKGSDRIGLLHSDSIFYYIEQISDSEQVSYISSLKLNQIARQQAMPISVSTADQVFTSVFKYPGYEKIYSTLTYSKVIIDEIQSYDPEIIAVILKGLVEISNLGGKFCLITATLPPIYKSYLEENIPNLYIPEPKILNVKKHRIELRNLSITDDIESIEETYEKFKEVLIIANTVKQAQNIYKLLDIKDKHLLHSGFIYKERRKKEEGILSSDNKEPKGVWVTTQLVEASLDIDFPVLFTELSSLDSLIQRMGRILRKMREGNYYGEPNIIIYTDASGIGPIYDKEIVKLTLDVLEDGLLSEPKKQELIRLVYSKEKLLETKYCDKFSKSLTLLESGFETQNKSEAQRIFRKISNITVIPHKLYEKYYDEIENAKKILTDYKKYSNFKRIKSFQLLRNLSVSIPYYKVYKKEINCKKIFRDYYWADLKYDELGIRNERISAFM